MINISHLTSLCKIMLASMILQSVVFAEEGFQVSCSQVQCPGIVRTQPLFSDEPIWLQLDIQGIQAKESILSYEVSAVLKSEGKEITSYFQRANVNTASNKSDILYLLEFPCQSAGKYVVDIKVTSKYNESPAICQIPIEIKTCDSLHVKELSFLSVFRRPIYPVYYEKEIVYLACILPRIEVDNSLSIDIYIDNMSNRAVHNEIRSNMQYQSVVWSLSINNPGKHEIIVVVKDSKDNKVQYKLPLEILPSNKLK